MKKRLLILLPLLMVSAWAVPGRMHIQGKLVDGNQLVNGVQRMTFTIFSAETGGTALYSETANVQVVDGLYEYELGQLSDAADMSGHLAGDNRWLETRVATTTLTPRQRLNATPFALVAHTVPDGTIVSSKLAAGAVDSSHIADGSITGADIAPGSLPSDLFARARMAPTRSWWTACNRWNHRLPFRMIPSCPLHQRQHPFPSGR